MISPYYPDDTPEALEDRRAFRFSLLAFGLVVAAAVTLAVLLAGSLGEAALFGMFGSFAGMAAAEIVYDAMRPRPW